MDLLAHLWKTYGDFDTGNLTANEKRMKAQWLPQDTIESLYKQLSNGKYFAAEGGEVLSETLLMRYGYDNILATGLFNTHCSKWRKMKSTENHGTSSRSSSRLLQNTTAKMQQRRTSTLQLTYKKW